MYKVPVRPPETASELGVANVQSGTYFNFGFSELVGRIEVATGAGFSAPLLIADAACAHRLVLGLKVTDKHFMDSAFSTCKAPMIAFSWHTAKSRTYSSLFVKR